jgi:hypothetical protein
MTKFDKQLKILSKLHFQVDELETEMSSSIESHLGLDWFITYDRGDGILLGSPDAYNYRISTYIEAQNMPRDEAIEYIERYPFN